MAPKNLRSRLQDSLVVARSHARRTSRGFMPICIGQLQRQLHIRLS